MIEKEPLYIFTFTYEDGHKFQFGTSVDAFETYGDDFNKPWFTFCMSDGGLGFVKTEGLVWATITKEPV